MSIDSFAWLRGSRLAALAGAAALLAVHTASAQECEKDADCGDGYVCKTGEQIVNCADPAAPCEKGDKCPEIPPPDCQMQEYKYCAAAPCVQDSDCPSDMACVEYTSGGCASAGSAPASCKPGEECPQIDPQPAPEPECMVETISECMPRYRLPCEHDADCGEGFKCKEQIYATCSGSSSSGSSGGGFDPGAGGKAGTPEDAGMAEPMPVPEQTCTSEPSGEFMCELQEIACETADDCPANFECQDNPNRAVCTSAGTATPPSDGAGGHAIAADAGVAPDDSAGNAGAGGSAADDSCGGVNDSLPKTVCLPRGYYTYGARDDLGAAESTGTSKGGSADPQVGGTPVPGADGNGGKGGETSGSANGTHSAAKPDADNMDTKASDDGCAVAAPGSTHEAGHGLGLLGVLGISALLMRRRARRTA